MTKRKLKGINSKRIPKYKKEKMKKTLIKMDKTRENDNILLRDLLQSKLKFAIAEREKGIKLIEVYQQKITQTKQQILKLEGAIITIQGTFNASKKKDEEISDKSND